MSLLNQFLIYAVCAAALVASVSAVDVNCVKCQDATTCNDPLDTAVVTTKCTLTDSQVCGKYTFKTKDATTTTRDCFEKLMTCDLLKTQNVANIVDSWSCYTCTGELCNKQSSDGNSFAVPMVTMLLGAMISLYLK